MSLTVSYGCWLSLIFSKVLLVDARLSLSPTAASCLSLSLTGPWNCCMSLNVSHVCRLCLTFSPIQ